MFSKPSPKPDQTPNSNSADSLSDHSDSNEPVPSSDQIENRFAELKALIKSSDNSSNVHELSEIEIQFRIGLMENISEGAIFVNKNKEIICWNRSAEMITGLTASNMIGVQFNPGIIGLKPSTSENDDQLCALSKCLKTHKRIAIEHTLVGKSGRKVNIELAIVPVIHSMQCHGAVILLRDLSANKDLKQQLTALKNSSSLDPLTHVANRAEFEKSLQEYAAAHRSTNSKCCLIIGDIDYFKMVNDTYGHNVGDQALVAFAQTLQQFVRSRDIVARYGGEEFVILCANCDIENAVARAEQIRTSLTRTPQAMLDGKTLSASFGVAELLPKEDVTEFFVRADKALYAAKQNGRNRVERASSKKKKSRAKSNVEISPATGIAWKKISKGAMFCEEYCTTTPSDLLADKLRGYITDNEAKIVKIEPNYASIKVVAQDVKKASRTTEFRVDIEFREFDELVQGQKQTCIRITVFPPIPRLFKKVHKELHSFLVSDIRRFFMLTDDSALVTLNPAATSSGRD